MLKGHGRKHKWEEKSVGSGIDSFPVSIGKKGNNVSLQTSAGLADEIALSWVCQDCYRLSLSVTIVTEKCTSFSATFLNPIQPLALHVHQNNLECIYY